MNISWKMKNEKMAEEGSVVGDVVNKKLIHM